MDSQQKQNPEFGSGKQETQNSNPTPNKFDLPSFKCNACSYVSIWKHAVKRHQQTHYKGMNIPPESKRKKYQCKHCSFTGNNWKKLQEHQNLHRLAQKPNTSRNQTEEELTSSDEDEKPDKPKHNLLKDAKESPNGEIEDPQSNLIVLDDSIKKSSVSKMESSQSRLKKYLEKAEKSKFGNMSSCTRCGVVNDCEAQLEQHMKSHEQKLKVEETTSVINQKKSDLNTDHNKEPIQDLAVKTTSTKPVARTRRGKFFDVPVKMTKNGLFQCEHCSYQTAIRTALVKHQTNHLKNANS